MIEELDIEELEAEEALPEGEDLELRIVELDDDEPDQGGAATEGGGKFIVEGGGNFFVNESTRPPSRERLNP